jgi:hypothetical protein
MYIDIVQGGNTDSLSLPNLERIGLSALPDGLLQGSQEESLKTRPEPRSIGDLVINPAQAFEAFQSFSSTKEETRLEKARKILSVVGKELVDEELDSYLTQFNFLVDSWLDEYERLLFNNKTLIELTKEG